MPLTVSENAGIAREGGFVTSGVPFPQGALRTNADVRLLDEQGAEVPLQVRTTATWRDGSVKWLLLDFPTDVAAHATRVFSLEYGEDIRRMPPTSPAVRVESNAEHMWVDTGRLRLELGQTNTPFARLIHAIYWDLDGNGRFDPNERAAYALGSSMTLAGPLRSISHLPPEEIVVEESGPLRAVVKISGWFCDVRGTNRVPFMKYLWRLHAFAGSPRLKVQFTATNLDPTNKMVLVDRYSIGLGLALDHDKLPPPVAEDRAISDHLLGLDGWIGGGSRPHHVNLGGRQSNGELRQLHEGGYEFFGAPGQAKGFRAPGWAAWQDTRFSAVLAVRHFWQQFPAALRVDNDGLGVEFYAASAGKPLDWDQGLAKTHEVWLEFGPPSFAPRGPSQEFRPPSSVRLLTSPETDLFALAPAKWYCDSKVFGDLLPFDFDRFPDYETLTEASGDQFIKRMATGWRHWGDVYYGGEYKGTNSYTNLEYDMHHNFYCQFARTGLRKYLDTAITMAAHQADIDTNHKTGWQWKHSPRHVEIQAEFGHTFTRGLLETYFLTGNRRCLEAAVELGDYFAKDIRNPRALGNERQIGWALISLLPVYEATWDKKYFDAARATVDRLLDGLDDRGKFKIRWDNRIAFFNGIAATGLIYYERATGDKRVAEAALKVIRRARGFYPEYNGRTLEAIAWACQRTGEPADLDFLARTWETTLARQISWNVMELGAPTIFTVHALPFLAESGFVPKPETPLALTPAQFDTANGLFARHLPAGDAELYLKINRREPLDLVVVRKGAWKSSGTATLYDAAGNVAGTLEFPREGVIWQRKAIHLPAAADANSSTDAGRALPGATAAASSVYRLALRSPSVGNVRGGSYVTWDVVTSRPAQGVFNTPEHRGLEFVTPALFTMPRGDSPKIELELAAEGEGFKRAVIYDPDDRVAGSVEAFIDLGDKGRYHYKVSAPIPPEQMCGIWKISLQDVSVEKMSGIAPYFSTSRQSFFRPDQAN